MLSLISAQFPASRELVLYDPGLEQPSAQLAHLTYLELYRGQEPEDGTAAPLLLATAAPRLEVLKCYEYDGTVASAAAGHTCLRELDLNFSAAGDQFDVEAEWLDAASELPAVSKLAFSLACFAGEGMAESAFKRMQLLKACGWLSHWEQVAELELCAYRAPPTHEALAAVGVALGSRLRSLTLTHTLVPPTQAAAAGALHALATCYAQLEVLTLRLCAPDEMAEEQAEARASRGEQAAARGSCCRPSLRSRPSAQHSARW